MLKKKYRKNEIKGKKIGIIKLAKKIGPERISWVRIACSSKLGGVNDFVEKNWTSFVGNKNCQPVYRY
jgi:hypothetical protein